MQTTNSRHHTVPSHSLAQPSHMLVDVDDAGDAVVVGVGIDDMVC